jgi:hypothetical protein
MEFRRAGVANRQLQMRTQVGQYRLASGDHFVTSLAAGTAAALRCDVPGLPRVLAIDDNDPVNEGYQFTVHLDCPPSVGAAFDCTNDDANPTCEVPFVLCDSIDFNGDGVFPDLQDQIDFVSVFGGGACPTSTCGDIDFNNDGVFPDLLDNEAFLRVFAGGACLQ